MIKELINGELTQDEVLFCYNASISYIYLPKFINGFIFSYKNINNIIINKNLSYYKKKKTILHELAHIELNHINQNKELFAFYIKGIEDEADRYIKFIKENLYENRI